MKYTMLTFVILCVVHLSNGDTSDILGTTPTTVTQEETTTSQNLFDSCAGDWMPCSVCRCCYGDSRTTVECRGPNVTHIPNDLPADITTLTFADTYITNISGDPNNSLHPGHEISRFIRYPKLRVLTFSNNLLLENITFGAFDFAQSQSELAYLDIKGSPRLQKIPRGALANFYKLDTLKITYCGLQYLPDWFLFQSHKHTFLQELDLSGNKLPFIKPLAFESLDMAVARLSLDNNSLERIATHAFSGSKIRKLYIRNNPLLTDIEEDAFLNATKLESLDLSSTSITRLPTNGLSQLVNLTLSNVYSLKIFPSVLSLLGLAEAKLTYPHHCCAFAHPEKQDSRQWADFIDLIERECSTMNSKPTPTPTEQYLFFDAPTSTVPRWLKRSLEENLRKAESDEHDGWHDSVLPTRQRRSENYIGEGNGFHDNMSVFNSWGDANMDEVWHQSTLNPNETYTSIFDCGLGVVKDTYIDRLKKVHCTPVPDAFNPCEDVMGFNWLRVFVWFVIAMAITGNVIVLFVTLCSKYKITVAKFLMCNLAFADFTLGLYILIVASFDVHTIGVYFTYAIPWQYGGGCQAAGFLAVFATNLSIFTLTVITMERWYAISHAINLTKRLRLRQAAGIMLGIWIYSVVMATLPLINISSYSKTSICLPMETSRAIDKTYVLFLLLSNAAAFIVILYCYIDMYIQVRGNQSAAGRNDANIAKRMAVLVFTDFACLFPLAFFGLTAAAGKAFITVTNSKILLVFFFPLNACCNPYLYAIFTKQFKKDLYGALNRCGFCQGKASKYLATFTSNPVSSTHSRNSIANNHVIHHRNSTSSALTNLTNLGQYLHESRGRSNVSPAARTQRAYTTSNGYRPVPTVMTEQPRDVTCKRNGRNGKSRDSNTHSVDDFSISYLGNGGVSASRNKRNTIDNETSFTDKTAPEEVNVHEGLTRNASRNSNSRTPRNSSSRTPQSELKRLSLTRTDSVDSTYCLRNEGDVDGDNEEDVVGATDTIQDNTDTHSVTSHHSRDKIRESNIPRNVTMETLDGECHESQEKQRTEHSESDNSVHSEGQNGKTKQFLNPHLQIGFLNTSFSSLSSPEETDKMLENIPQESQA